MTSETPETRRLSGITRIEILVTVVIILMCMGVAGAWPGVAFFLLLFGWIKYPIEAGDRLTVEWTSVVTACIALILFTGGMYRFGRWLAAAKSTEEKPRSWTFRNAAQTVLLILFAFVAGTSMIGVVHQVAWLSTSKEPLLNPSGAQVAAERSSSKNNLKLIGAAHHQYHDVHDSFAGSTFAPDGKAWHSWQTYLLPYIDQASLYEQIDQNRPWNDPANQKHFRVGIPVYQNPGIESDGPYQGQQPALTHYAGNIRLLRPNQSVSLREITDGAARTILAGEVSERFKAWGDPTNLRDPVNGINQSPTGFGSPFPGGADVLFADGGIRLLSEDIDPDVLKALSTPAGGELIQDGDW